MTTPSTTYVPTPQERRQIAARAFMAERQVLLCYQHPERRKPSVLARAQRAAAELGIRPPAVQEAA